MLGLALAVGLGALLYRRAIKINLRTFFRLTGAVIIVIAAGLFAFGIHELQGPDGSRSSRGTPTT